MIFSSKVPPAVIKFFGNDVMKRELRPVIVSEFDPAAGWKRQNSEKVISRSTARKLAKQGVTHIVLKSGVRQADFSVSELATQAA